MLTENASLAYMLYNKGKEFSTPAKVSSEIRNKVKEYNKGNSLEMASFGLNVQLIFTF